MFYGKTRGCKRAVFWLYSGCTFAREGRVNTAYGGGPLTFGGGELVGASPTLRREGYDFFYDTFDQAEAGAVREAVIGVFDEMQAHIRAVGVIEQA